MSFKKFLSYLIPFTTKYKSDINGVLEVTLYNGKKVLDTANANFSYGSVHRIFQTSLTKIDLVNTKNVLLLGLGAGSVIDLLRNKFAYLGNLTAVEFDPQITKIAKTEFNLESIGQLRIIEGDAFIEVKKLDDKYDLIIVDLFIDNTIPSQLYDLTFWKNINRINSKGGTIVFNTISKTTENLFRVRDYLKKEGYQMDSFYSPDNVNCIYIWNK